MGEQQLRQPEGEDSPMRLENEQLVFEMAEQRPWTVSVTVKKTGKAWRSHMSPLAVRCWEFYLYRSARKRLDEFEKVNWRMKVHGSVASVAFEIVDWGLFLNLDFHLRGDEIDVRVPMTQIHEQAPHEYRLMDLELLPGFGSAPAGTGGHIVLACKAGTLVKLDRTQPGEIDWPVYGGYPYDYTVPAFGLTAEGEAIAANILEGDCDAWICVRLAQGQEKLNWSHARLHYRYYPNVDFDRIDRVVRYSFLGGEEATWQGMARRVRDQIISDRADVRLVRERFGDQPALEHATRSLRLVTGGVGKPRIRGGMPGGWGSLTHPARSRRVSTTFKQAVGMLRSIREVGDMPLSLKYTGIWFDGHDGAYPHKLPLARELGGNRGFRQLMDYANAHDVDVIPMDNFTDLYDTSALFDRNDCTRMVNGDVRRGGVWYGGHAYIACPLVAGRKHMPAHFEEMEALGKRNGAWYCDTYPGPWLHECHHPDHPLNRRQFSEQIGRNMACIRERFGVVEGEGICAHVIAWQDIGWGGVAEIEKDADRPWFADRLVPFCRIVFHGIVLWNAQHARAGGNATEGAKLALRRSVARDMALGGVPRIGVEPATIAHWRAHLAQLHEQWIAPAARNQSLLIKALEENERAVHTEFEDGTVAEADMVAGEFHLESG